MRGVYGAAIGVLLILPVPAAPQSPPLDFAVSVPDTVARGASVRITLRLRNTSATPAEVHFVGRTITFDIVVRRRDGTIAWQRLGNAALPSILQIRTLAPGETMEWTDTWRAAQPGAYEVQGVLPSDDAEPRRTPWRPVVVR